MDYRVVDMGAYPRKEHFAYFRSLAFPYVGVTRNVDITASRSIWEGRPLGWPPLPDRRKSGFRRSFEDFMAPLRLRRGKGAMKGNPCYARHVADLPYTPPNPIGSLRGAEPSATCGERSEAKAQRARALKVLPAFQKQGVGSQLLSLARAHTPTLLYFGAKPGAEGFYEKTAVKKGCRPISSTSVMVPK